MLFTFCGKYLLHVYIYTYSMYMFVSKTSQTKFYVFIINGVNDCDINSDCINTDGSYTCTCTCHPGYSGNGRNCCEYTLNIV